MGNDRVSDLENCLGAPPYYGGTETVLGFPLSPALPLQGGGNMLVSPPLEVEDAPQA